MKKEMNYDKIRFVDFITGEKYTGQWRVKGTDLGIPFYSRKEDKLYFVFGDTFDSSMPSDNSYWRGTIAGYTHDFDFSEGIRWDGFLEDENGAAKELIWTHHSKNEEYFDRTKICQGGIEIDGAIYLFYECIRHWGEAGYWDVNYAGVIKSTDCGKTFSRVNQLSWVESDEGEFVDKIQTLSEEDIHLQPSGEKVDLSKRVAPFFAQIYPAYGKDGYVYIYGRRAGRQFGIKVGRVKIEQFENFDEYEYLVRFENGNAVWKKGKEALKEIAENEAAADIIKGATSNMSVVYNSYLRKWMLIFYRPGKGIVYQTSNTPYGEFSDEKMLIPENYAFPSGHGCYGAFSHERMLSRGGRLVYVVVSQWTKTLYSSMMYEISLD